MPPATLYTQPRVVTDPGDCYFYHTMDIPQHGLVQGEWDLRRGIERYLGHVDFRGKRVLDVGAASGFLSFTMERLGAKVVSYDLSAEHHQDIIPFAGANLTTHDTRCRDAVRRLNNAYWYSHRQFKSRARLVQGTVYTIPPEIGPVDVAVLGSILLHLRDPFLAVQRAAQLSQDTVIIADMIPRRRVLNWLLGCGFKAEMLFLPRAADTQPVAGWWYLSPELVRQWLAVLGFEDTRVTYHSQPFQGSRRLLYTIVGRRTKTAAILPEMPTVQDRVA